MWNLTSYKQLSSIIIYEILLTDLFATFIVDLGVFK